MLPHSSFGSESINMNAHRQLNTVHQGVCEVLLKSLLIHVIACWWQPYATLDQTGHPNIATNSPKCYFHLEVGWDEKLNECKHLYFELALVPRIDIKSDIIFIIWVSLSFLFFHVSSPCFDQAVQGSLTTIQSWPLYDLNS